MSDPKAPESGQGKPAIAAEFMSRLQQSETAAGASASIATAPATQEDSDRSLIGRRIVTLYVWAIPLTLGVILVNGLVAHAMAAASAEAADLIKVAVIPIVTLVLGYYFGKAAKP